MWWLADDYYVPIPVSAFSAGGIGCHQPGSQVSLSPETGGVAWWVGCRRMVVATARGLMDQLLRTAYDDRIDVCTAEGLVCRTSLSKIFDICQFCHPGRLLWFQLRPRGRGSHYRAARNQDWSGAGRAWTKKNVYDQSFVLSMCVLVRDKKKTIHKGCHVVLRDNAKWANTPYFSRALHSRGYFCCCWRNRVWGEKQGCLPGFEEYFDKDAEDSCNLLLNAPLPHIFGFDQPLPNEFEPIVDQIHQRLGNFILPVGWLSGECLDT